MAAYDLHYKFLDKFLKNIFFIKMYTIYILYPMNIFGVISIQISNVVEWLSTVIYNFNAYNYSN